MIDTAYQKAGLLLNVWLGHECSVVERYENLWRFRFGQAGGLDAYCPWRIVTDGRIAFSDEDEGQQFGLPAPIDGQAKASELLSNRRVVDVRISDVSGDLTISLEGSTTIELFNNSSGYEAWLAHVNGEKSKQSVVAQGGGQIVVLNTPS
jgi:hypothetical protein